MTYTDKTIPYRPSPAELECIRLLREKTKSSVSILDGKKEDKMAGETDAWTSNPGPVNQTAEEDIP